MDDSKCRDTRALSVAATAAVPYVASFARIHGAALWALHVRPPTISTMIEEGDLWPILKRMIATNKIDLLVMGTSGRSGGGKLLLGSIAEEVFRKAPCPVLTVGPRSPAKPGLDAEISRILFATSLGPKSASTAAYAISLTETYQAYLTLLHVVEEPKNEDVAQHTGLVKCCEARLCSLVPPEAKLWCIPDYRVEQGGVAEKILEVSLRRNIDLIVLGAQRATGFPGAASHLSTSIAHNRIGVTVPGSHAS